MLLNEHLSKVLLKEAAGLPVPTGVKITEKDLPELEPYFPLPWILKAQVPVGGRGKAGGIQKVDSRTNTKKSPARFSVWKSKETRSLSYGPSLL